MRESIYISIIGLVIGYIMGMSTSPTVGIILSSLLGIAGSLATFGYDWLKLDKAQTMRKQSLKLVATLALCIFLGGCVGLLTRWKLNEHPALHFKKAKLWATYSVENHSACDCDAIRKGEKVKSKLVNDIALKFLLSSSSANSAGSNSELVLYSSLPREIEDFIKTLCSDTCRAAKKVKK